METILAKPTSSDDFRTQFPDAIFKEFASASLNDAIELALEAAWRYVGEYNPPLSDPDDIHPLSTEKAQATLYLAAHRLSARRSAGGSASNVRNQTTTGLQEGGFGNVKLTDPNQVFTTTPYGIQFLAIVSGRERRLMSSNRQRAVFAL